MSTPTDIRGGPPGAPQRGHGPGRAAGAAGDGGRGQQGAAQRLGAVQAYVIRDLCVPLLCFD